MSNFAGTGDEEFEALRLPREFIFSIDKNDLARFLRIDSCK